MTIKKIEKETFVRFEELISGTVFEHEGEIYMKAGNTKESTSVVELEFGCLGVIEKDTLVKPLDAKLEVIE